MGALGLTAQNGDVRLGQSSPPSPLRSRCARRPLPESLSFSSLLYGGLYGGLCVRLRYFHQARADALVERCLALVDAHADEVRAVAPDIEPQTISRSRRECSGGLGKRAAPGEHHEVLTWRHEVTNMTDRRDGRNARRGLGPGGRGLRARRDGGGHVPDPREAEPRGARRAHHLPRRALLARRSLSESLIYILLLSKV